MQEPEKEATPDFKVCFDRNGNALWVEDLEGRRFEDGRSVFPLEFGGQIMNVTSTSVMVTQDPQFGFCRWVHLPDCRWIRVCF